MMTFWGKIENGTLSIYNRTKVNREIAILGDGIVEISLKHKKQRSLQQNKYYWGIVVFEIRRRLEELGNQFKDEDVHAFLKDRFNSKPVIGAGGELLGEVGTSTTLMSKEEFGIYIEKIIQWSAEFLEIIIPYPGEQTEFEL